MTVSNTVFTADELLLSIASTLNNIAADIEDEGDRAYFGSTNDADKLKEIAEQIDQWRFDRAAPAEARLERALTERDAEIERLRDHIFGHAVFAEYSIKDGIEMGASVWRIALENIAKENRSALSTTKTDEGLAEDRSK